MCFRSFQLITTGYFLCTFALASIVIQSNDASFIVQISTILVASRSVESCRLADRPEHYFVFEKVNEYTEDN